MTTSPQDAELIGWAASFMGVSPAAGRTFMDGPGIHAAAFHAEPPPYLDDMAEAWAVAMKVIGLGFDITLTQSASGAFMCWFTQGAISPQPVLASSAERAILEASRRAHQAFLMSKLEDID